MNATLTPEAEFSGYVDNLTDALGGNRGAALVMAQNPDMVERLERIAANREIIRLGCRVKRIRDHKKSLGAVLLSLKYETRWQDRDALLAKFEGRITSLLADLQELSDNDSVLIRREQELLAALEVAQ